MTTTHDALTALRQQLVDAIDQPHHDATATPGPHHWRVRRRTAVWAATVAIVGLPAAGAAAGIISLPSATTSDGTTYTVAPIPATAIHGVTPDAKDCEAVTATDSSGKRQLANLACGADAQGGTASALVAGFTITSSQEMVVHGSTGANASTLQVVDLNRSIPLHASGTNGRRNFIAVLPLGDHTLRATQADGTELGQSEVGP
jgi:hypothetical protein